MRFGNLSVVAELRPVLALSTSIIFAMSRPLAMPKATASDVAANAVADRKLLASFIEWPWRERTPTWKTLPVNDSSNARCAVNTSAGPLNINEIVAARAPAAPPDTGPSQYVTPTDSSSAAAWAAAAGPIVERSISVSTIEPSAATIASATANVAAPSGTLIKTVVQRRARSAIDSAATA